MTEQLTYFTVVADLRALVADSIVDEGSDIDSVPVSATVTFKPLIASGDLILATNADPRPTGFVGAPVVATIGGTDGRLKLRSTPADGYPYTPVRLLASSPVLELTEPLAYAVTFSDVKWNNGTQFGSIKGFTFIAPDHDTELNLITVARAPGQQATGITKIAPTSVRFTTDSLIFSFDGDDLPEPLALADITGPQGLAATVSVGDVATVAYDQPAAVTNAGTSGDAVLDFTIPEGEPATVAVGDVTTVTPADPATVTNTGTARNAVFDFEIPQGAAATVEVGSVSAVPPGDPATVTNTGTTAEAVFDFNLPQGAAATISVGDVATGTAGSSATVTNTGDTSAVVLDFTIPRGDKGDAATVTVGDVSTLAPGSSATVTNTGTTGDAVLDIGLPQGDTGATGPTGPMGPTGAKGDAATVSVGTITTVSPTSSASVTNVGTSSAAVFNFSIPKGDTGSADATEWGAIPGQPAVIAAGATEADARDAIDAEYTGARGIANGIATLDSAGKVPMSQLPASLLSYQGTWSAASNTPTLSDAGGDVGDVYRVTAPGSVNLGSGTLEFATGDYIIKASTGIWEKSDGTDSVTSVAGKTGVITLTKADVGLGDVDNTSDLAKPISTATQAALDGKEPTVTAGSSTQYYRGDKTFATLDKSAVGLSNVDNTTDLGKPISTATQAALDAKEPTVAGGTTAQYYRGDKSFQTLNRGAVGLGAVDNTADADKPISTAAAAALAGKEPTVTAGTAGQYYRGDKVFATLDKTAVGLGNVDNIADADKPISTATSAALAGKEPTITSGTAGQYWTGAKTFATLDKSAVGLGNVDNTSDATKNAASAVLTNKTISGANNTVTNLGVAAIGASGTPSSTTFLRGDGSWQAVSGGITRSVQTVTSNNTTIASTASIDQVVFANIPKSSIDPLFANTTVLLNMNGTTGSTSFVDSSNNAWGMTSGGEATISTAQSKFGGAAGYFNGGTGSWVTVTSNTSLNFGTGDFTLEAWVRFDNFNRSQVIIGGTAANSIGLRYGTGFSPSAVPTPGFSLSRTGVADLEHCALSLSVNTWYHVAVVRQSAVIKFFVDGIQRTTAGSGGAATYSWPAEAAIRLGDNGGSEKFTGFMDDVRATKAARYTANFTPPTSQLSGATSNLTIPTAVSSTNQISIKNIHSTDPLTVATTSSQTIDGETALRLASGTAAVRLISDGANWRTI